MNRLLACGCFKHIRQAVANTDIVVPPKDTVERETENSSATEELVFTNLPPQHQKNSLKRSFNILNELRSNNSTWKCDDTGNRLKFDHDGHLEEAFFDKCSITVVPQTFHKLAFLKNVWLSNNAIESLPETFCLLPGLESLWLNNNKLITIANIPPCVKALYLSKNPLFSLNGIGCLTNLEKLGVDTCDLREIPPEIGNLTRLTVLEAHSNGFKRLPAEIGKLSALKRLSIHTNAIRTLPNEIGNLASLT